MAASQKKTGGKRTSSGGTRRSGSASGSSRGNSRGSKAPARRPMRREIGAAVCLALALFAALGYFHIQAIFIDFFSGLLKGLLGYGFWLMPPALLLAAYILAFHRGRPVRLRVTCALLLPLLFSCIVHGLLGRVLPWDAALVKTLWAAGEELTSGGVLGGVLAQGSVQVFSRLGSTIQIANTGISPGSGVQNSRKELSERTLGVPVISVGVPTVIDGATLAAQFTGQDRGKIDPQAAQAMVTPREVDRMIGHAAKFISLAVNKALYPQLSLEEISFLCA